MGHRKSRGRKEVVQIRSPTRARSDLPRLLAVSIVSVGRRPATKPIPRKTPGCRGSVSRYTPTRRRIRLPKLATPYAAPAPGRGRATDDPTPPHGGARSSFRRRIAA